MAQTGDETVKKYEEMFADRYTDADPEYRKTKETPVPDPPCVTGYHARSNHSFDGNRGRGDPRQQHQHNRGGQGWNRNQSWRQ